MLINWLVKKWEDPMKKMKVDDFSASPKPTEEERRMGYGGIVDMIIG